MRATPLGTSRLGVHDVMGFVKGKGQGLPVLLKREVKPSLRRFLRIAVSGGEYKM